MSTKMLIISYVYATPNAILGSAIWQAINALILKMAKFVQLRMNAAKTVNATKRNAKRI